RVEVLAAAGAVMLRVDEVDVTRAGGDQVADVVQGAGEDPVSTTALAAARTGSVFVVPAPSDDLRFGQVCWIGDALGGIRQVLPGTRHGKALLGQAFPAPNLRVLLSCVTVTFPVTLLKTRKSGQVRMPHSILMKNLFMASS